MRDPCNDGSVEAKMDSQFKRAYKELTEINDAVETLLSEMGAEKDP